MLVKHMIADFGSRSVQDWYKVKVQSKNPINKAKFKVVQGKYNLFYITFLIKNVLLKIKKYKNNNI